MKLAIDAVSDDKGNISIYRLGILGEYNQEDNKFTANGDSVEIDVRVSVAPGKVIDNYGKPDTAKFDDGPSTGEVKEQKDKYGLGYYGVSHASEPQWVKKPNRPQDYPYQGGSVSGKKDPDGLKEVGKSKIKFDGNKHKTNPKESTTIEGGKNTAKGRY